MPVSKTPVPTHPRYWPTWVGVGLMRLLSLLPLRLLWLLGVLFGELLYRLHRERRHVVTTNIDRCFPDFSARKRARLVRRHFHAFGQCLLDVGVGWWASPRRLGRLFRLRGREHYDAAMKKGRPIILLAPHFVGLDLGWTAVSRERAAVTVYRHVKNPVFDRIARAGRTRFGGRVIEIGRGFQGVVRALREGRPFYYLPDQDLGRRRSVFVPFFGIQTATVPALGRLAEMTDAVVIPCITRQLPRGRGYEVAFLPPPAGFPSGDTRADARRMNEIIEKAVRERPEQYVWVHKRFKTRPEGEKDFYS